MAIIEGWKTRINAQVPVVRDVVPSAPAAAILLFALGSGLWLSISSSWTHAYVALIFAHPIAGALCGAGLFYHLLRFGVVDESQSVRVVWTYLIVVACLSLVIMVFAARGPVPEIATIALVGLVSLAGAFVVGRMASRLRGTGKNPARILAFVVLTAAWIVPRFFPRTAVVVVGSVLVSAVVWIAFPSTADRFGERFMYTALVHSFAQTFYSGGLILTIGTGKAAMPAFWWHRWVAAFLCVMIVVYLVHDRLVRHKWVIRSIHRRWIVLTSLAFVAAISVDSLWPDPTYRLHLSTVPNAERGADEKIDQFNIAHPERMALTRSCGSAGGCHAEILDDYLPSQHNRSIQSPYFQFNLDYMVEQIGMENKNLCAGCHIQEALFNPDLSYKDFARKDNMGCVVCHVISDVGLPEDRRRTTLDLTPNMRHLAYLEPIAGTDDMSWQNRMLINMDPIAHGRAFNRPIQRSDESCQACHRLQIRPTKDMGLLRGSCRDCHMQPRNTIGLEGTVANHRFPGSNASAPFSRGDMNQVAFTKRFMSGEFPLQLKAWGQTEKLEGDNSVGMWVEMHVEPRSVVYPGQEFKFVITTSNVGVDHGVPAAPLDLIEVWLQVTLKDANGRVLFENGALDEKNYVPADAHRMGGYMIGNDGHIVDKNRVWQIQKKVIERQLAFGRRTADGYSVVLPEDTVGPLRLEAVWNYRKLNQEFIDWAYGDGTTMPLTQLGTLDASIALDTSPDAPVPNTIWAASPELNEAVAAASHP